MGCRQTLSAPFFFPLTTLASSLLGGLSTGHNMSTALPALTSLFQRHVPDVPEDIDMMEHFNDPNWDYRPPSPTLSTESIDLDHKEKRADSSRHSTSDFDTESNAESSYGKTAVSYGRTEQSKSQLWTSGASEYEECVF